MVREHIPTTFFSPRSLALWLRIVDALGMIKTGSVIQSSGGSTRLRPLRAHPP
jgi:hypothetical protein